MILCVTPNPAIDRTARVARLTFGAVLRPTEVLALPGGKGINVARAAHALGALVTTTGFAGGHAGRWLVEALDAEGLNPRFVPVPGETRTTYVDRRCGWPLCARVRAGRHRVREDDVGAPARPCWRPSSLPSATWLAICGSPPPGMDARDLRRGRRGEPRRGPAMPRRCRVALRLAAALDARPDVVKVSRDEAETVTGSERGRRRAPRLGRWWPVARRSRS